MKSKLIIVFVFVFACFYASAQKELKSSQFKGKIVLKNGKTQDGIIQLNRDKDSPWDKQAKIIYITEENFAKEKLKSKDKEKYSAKNLKGFYIGDRYFESIKYADLSAVGVSMIPKMYFLEKFVDGKICIYRFYKSPGKVRVAVGEEEIEEMKRFEEECRTEPQMLIKLDNGKLKNVSDVDIYDYISSCEAVLEKYKNGEYGIKPIDNDTKKGIGKFVAKTIDANRIEGVIVTIADEFNACK